MTTIQKIITDAQKKRHDNHIRAGKNIKEKWKQEARKELIEDVEKIMNIIKKNRFQSFTKRWMILEDELKHLRFKR
jgi:hypothetical protein